MSATELCCCDVDLLLVGVAPAPSLASSSLISTSMTLAGSFSTLGRIFGVFERRVTGIRVSFED